jgi:uncharacterized repeat protein (TIGR01451 family)
MRSALGAWATFFILFAPVAASPGDTRAPSGLSPGDWALIRRSVELSEYRARPVAQASQPQATFVHEAHLFGHADSSQAHLEFGFAVAVDGDTVVVGAPSEDTAAGAGAGAAYVFVRSGTTWALQQKLLSSDAAPFDAFGGAVALAADTVVVGAERSDSPSAVNAGAAYVFVRSGTTWTEQHKLVASDGATDDLFGVSVSVFADTAVVGAYLDDQAVGSAYVFVRAGAVWTQQQKLGPSSPGFGGLFGGSVSIDGDTVVIGAQDEDTPGGVNAGAAYVFTRSGTSWTQQQRLLAGDGAFGDFFGVSVSISADTVVVGADWDDTASGAESGSAYVFVRSGTIWTEQQKLLASDAAADDHFGGAVAVSHDTVVVGAGFADAAAGVNAGAAYVFVRSGATWSQQQKLVPADGAAHDWFGYSVSVSTDTVAAGAPLADNQGLLDVGSAYLFVRSGTTWAEQQEVLPSPGPDSPVGDRFGRAVGVDGDTLVVGADFDSIPTGQQGSVYVFVRSGTVWTEQQKLFASDGATNDQFGYSVSVSGDTLVVGAYGHDTAPGQTGAAYVFVRSGTTWSEQQKLLASDGSDVDYFGWAVSISGDTIMVGAFNDQPGGSAYVFERSGTTWTEQQKILAADGMLGDSLGRSVALSGNTAVIGAPGANPFGMLDAGAAYVFVRAGAVWTQQSKLVASDGNGFDRFGESCAVHGDTAVVGAYRDDTAGGIDAGSAYVFVRSGNFWPEQQRLTASDGAAGDEFGAAVSLDSDVAVIGAALDNTPSTDAGSAYLFTRSGTAWSQRQKLLAPDGMAGDGFGIAVAVRNATAVAGAYRDSTAAGAATGSAHVFRGTEADLSISKTDGQAAAVPGEPLTYTIIASNTGPNAVTSGTVTDLVPAVLLGATWTCVASPGSSCTAGGSGSINDTVSLAVGGTATYTLTATVAPGATGTLSNTATVAGAVDPNPANNSATDIDTLTPEVDLTIDKTDSADPVSPGDALTYSLTVTNLGSSTAAGPVVVDDVLPAGVTFVSSSPGPPTCNLSGITLACLLGPLVPGGSSVVSIQVTVNPAAVGTLVNTAHVLSSQPDPDPTNNTATETTNVRGVRGELTHGAVAVYDLAAQGPVVHEDVLLISQKPRSSYEVVVDGTSGDIGAGTGPMLRRVGPDGTTVLQDSVAVGVGPSRSLRWRNDSSTVIDSHTIRVRSAQCSTDCGLDDVYRIRAYETTYSIPRFNNSGTQVTVLVLQNPTNDTISGNIYFGMSSGAQVGVHPFALSAKATLVLNTASVPGVSGVSGAITVAHDGRYAALSGKTVALEPSTGFSFDSPMEPRRK